MTTPISLDRVSFTYPGSRTPAINRVSLDVEPHQVTALMGPSGSGKSTLLSLIAGLEHATEGTLDRGDARVSMVFQENDLWAHLRAWEHLAICMEGRKSADRRAKAIEILADVGLEGHARRRPHQLSGGEARRLSLARALATEPDWLLLDEPLSQLDDPTRSSMLSLFRHVRSRTSVGILIASHRAEDVLGFATTVCVLRDGRLVQAATPERVYDEPVDLEAGLLLGPAAELHGTDDAGRVRVESAVVADGFEPGRIVRPSNVAFRAHEFGACALLGRLPSGEGVVQLPGRDGTQLLSGVPCDHATPMGAMGILVPRVRAPGRADGAANKNADRN